LASLLHDLGQYPLAHDIEEINPDIFGHAKLTVELLKSTIADAESRTLRQIIEDKVFGWGVPLNDVIKIIEAKPLRQRDRLSTSSFKTRLLATVIDGPIDADKVDYLLRDSRECRLNYGKVIDFERLLKTITVAHEYDTRSHGDNVSLAVYDKGRACAESIIFARYLLFSAVYWHHTTRTYKAMLHQALRLMLQFYGDDKKKLGSKLAPEILEFIKSLSAGKKKKQPSLVALLKKEYYKTLIYWSDLEILDWIYQRSPESAQNLLCDLAKRRLFKRLASIHFTTRTSNDEQNPWEGFQRKDFSTATYSR
jgi:HD superfamily phosphohydrolase